MNIPAGQTKITIRVCGAKKVQRTLRKVERRLRRIIKLQLRMKENHQC